MRTTLALLIFLSIAAIEGYAQVDFQPGFIITTSKDSLTGFLANQSQSKNYETCYFKKTLNDEAVRYQPGEIEAFGVYGKRRFKSHSLPNEKDEIKLVFAQTIIQSKMSLYKYGDEFYLETEKITRLPKNNDVRVYTEQGTNYSVRPGRRYVGLINFLMLDCSISADNADYQEKDMVDLVTRYNRCKNAPMRKYQPTGPQTMLHWQFYGGVDFSSINVDDFNEGKYENSSSVIFGAGMDLSIGSTEKSFLTIDAFYVEESFHLHTIRDNSNPIVQKWYTIESQFAKLALGFRHNFLKAEHSPYVRVGYVQYFSLKSFYNVKTEINDDGVINSSDDRRVLIDKKQAGIWGSVGYNNRLIGAVNIFAEVRYERCFGLAALNDQEATVNSINLLAGIRF